MTLEEKRKLVIEKVKSVKSEATLDQIMSALNHNQKESGPFSKVFDENEDRIFKNNAELFKRLA